AVPARSAPLSGIPVHRARRLRRLPSVRRLRARRHPRQPPLSEAHLLLRDINRAVHDLLHL
ncbi:Uncharacterized protein OBRU01_14474, partial [Operophtera brumata]